MVNEKGEIVKSKGEGVSLLASPARLLQDGKRASKALLSVIKQNPDWVAPIQDKDYLRFEAWQTVAKFYGCTVKTVESKYVEYNGIQGFEAKSVVVNSEGVEIGAGEGICMMDEKNWSGKPLYAVKSMAQTRSGARALRQVFSWVVVLAGYAPTAVEEMDGINTDKKAYPASEKQVNFISVLLNRKGFTKEQLFNKYNVERLEDLNKEQASNIIESLQKLGDDPSIDRDQSLNDY